MCKRPSVNYCLSSLGPPKFETKFAAIEKDLNLIQMMTPESIYV